MRKFILKDLLMLMVLRMRMVDDYLSLEQVVMQLLINNLHTLPPTLLKNHLQPINHLENRMFQVNQANLHLLLNRLDLLQKINLKR